jgi:Tfp pilus assembly protein PilV
MCADEKQALLDKLASTQAMLEAFRARVKEVYDTAAKGMFQCCAGNLPSCVVEYCTLGNQAIQVGKFIDDTWNEAMDTAANLVTHIDCSNPNWVQDVKAASEALRYLYITQAEATEQQVSAIERLLKTTNVDRCAIRE